MKMQSWRGTALLAFGAAFVVAFSGCDKVDTKPSQTKNGSAPEKEKPGQVATKNEDTKHSGWWCDEHGIPEAECSMCSPKVAAECKKKGDWCDKHDRAKSQCFLCDPKLKEKFAARYRVKYGKEPPPIEEEKP
jgi:hypothetical protein